MLNGENKTQDSGVDKRRMSRFIDFIKELFEPTHNHGSWQIRRVCKACGERLPSYLDHETPLCCPDCGNVGEFEDVVMRPEWDEGFMGYRRNLRWVRK